MIASIVYVTNELFSASYSLASSELFTPKLLRKWPKEISIHSLAGEIFTSLFLDLLKQVIALTKPAMEDLKSVVGGRKSLTVSEYSNLWEEYLAPWKVRETGDVRVVSGDRALTNFADKELRLVCS